MVDLIYLDDQESKKIISALVYKYILQHYGSNKLVWNINYI